MLPLRSPPLWTPPTSAPTFSCESASRKRGPRGPIDLDRHDTTDPRVQHHGNTGTYSDVLSLATEPLATYAVPRWAPMLNLALGLPRVHPGEGRHPVRERLGPGRIPEVGRPHQDHQPLRRRDRGDAGHARGRGRAVPDQDRVIGLTWVQDETDGDGGATGPTQAAALDALIDGLRASLAARTSAEWSPSSFRPVPAQQTRPRNRINVRFTGSIPEPAWQVNT